MSAPRLHADLVLAGELARETYKVEFQTVAHGDNGQMGFSGTLAAKRLGDCGAS